MANQVVVKKSQDEMCCKTARCEDCPNNYHTLSCGADTYPQKTLFVTNSFSLGMMDKGDYSTVLEKLLVVQLNDEQAKKIIDFASESHQIVSGVGHANTAAILSDILEIEIPENRISLKFRHKDLILVGQYSGPRLPEGSTSLPEGASIKWYLVSTEEDDWSEFGEGRRFPNSTIYPGGKATRPFTDEQLKGLVYSTPHIF